MLASEFYPLASENIKTKAAVYRNAKAAAWRAYLLKADSAPPSIASRNTP